MTGITPLRRTSERVTHPGPRVPEPPAPSPLTTRPHPSGTTITFILLILTLALTGVFVGDWLYLGMSPVPGTWGTTPFAWLAWPPALTLGATAALALALPRWLERRRGLVDVPETEAAMSRTAQLAAEAGVRPPQLKWNPKEVGSSALAYGVPGRYRLVVTPALLGAARRHKDRFDLVLRHELAHVRNHDVVLAYAAICAWYALLALLVVPLVWKIFDPDRSLVPEYLVRFTILALLVYLLRAALLRSREHDADLRVASWSGQADDYADLLATGGLAPARPGAVASETSMRRWFVLHPTPDARAQVVRSPARAARVRIAEFYAVGVLTGISLPLLGTLVISLSAVDPLRGHKIACVVAFGALGAYAGATLLRAAGAGSLGRWVPAQAAAAMTAGIGTGALVSPGMTGLLEVASMDAVADLVIAVLVSASLVTLADLLCRGAHGMHRATGPAGSTVVVVLAAATAALAALAALPVTVPISAAQYVAPTVVGKLITAYLASPSLAGPHVLLAALLVTVAIATCGMSRDWPSLMGAAAWGTAGGLVGASWAAGVGQLVDLADQDVVTTYYNAAPWLCTGAAVLTAIVAALLRRRRPVAVGLIAGAVATLVATLGYAVAAWASGGDVRGGAATKLAVGAALVVGVPLLALGSLARPSDGPARWFAGHRAVWGAGVALAATTLVLVAAPAAITARSAAVGDELTLEQYVDEYVPRAVAAENQATIASQGTGVAVGSAKYELIRETVLPMLTTMISEADLIRVAPEATAAQSALRALFRAERLAYSTQADVWESPTAENRDANRAAFDRLRVALGQWSVEYQRVAALRSAVPAS